MRARLAGTPATGATPSAAGAWARSAATGSPARCRGSSPSRPSSRRTTSPTGPRTAPAPTALDDASASVFHIAYQTGWFGLYRRANLRVGDTLLVHAAAGGVGSAAVQLGRAAGAKVIGVVGSAEKVAVARRLGAETVIDRSQVDVIEAVKEATGGRGADVVYDPVGGPAYEVSKKVVAFEGRIVVVGFASGDIPQAAANHVLIKNYAVLGLHWMLYRKYHPELIARAHTDLSSLVGVGALAPLVSRKLSFEDAPEGIAAIAAGTTVGRLAVSPP